MPAVAAARHNPDMKRFYDRHTYAGKPTNVAITAIIHKFIILANSLIKQDRMWVKSPLTKTDTIHVIEQNFFRQLENL